MENMYELYFSLGVFAWLLLLASLGVIGRAFVFSLAGEAWWKSFIPFYGSFVQHKLAFGEEAKWLWFINIIVPVYSCYQEFVFARTFGKSIGFAVAYLFFQPIMDFIIYFKRDSYEGPHKHFLQSA